MKALLTTLIVTLLTGCSFFEGDGPPLQGTVRGDDPRAAELWQEAQHYETVGETKKAIKSYKKLVDTYPADKRAARARFTEAALLNSLGNPRAAFQDYQKFIERYPGDTLYSEAITQQEELAHAAAEGEIGTSFFGKKSRLDRGVIVGMLGKVRDNAPRADSAPRAQYMIGQVNEFSKQPKNAIAAYERLVEDYARSELAPGSQFRIGEILLKQAEEGNQNKANLARAKDAYQDLLLAYPDSSFSEQAKLRIANIGSRDLQASYGVAEFYRKKGELDSASYYYQEIVDGAPPSQLRNSAAARLAELKPLLPQ